MLRQAQSALKKERASVARLTKQLESQRRRSTEAATLLSTRDAVVPQIDSPESSSSSDMQVGCSPLSNTSTPSSMSSPGTVFGSTVLLSPAVAGAISSPVVLNPVAHSRHHHNDSSCIVKKEVITTDHHQGAIRSTSAGIDRDSTYRSSTGTPLLTPAFGWSSTNSVSLDPLSCAFSPLPPAVMSLKESRVPPFRAVPLAPRIRKTEPVD
jgi:hypothetical protein